MNNKKIICRGLFDKVMIPCYNPMDIILEKGLGSTVWSQTGDDYIDFAGGIAVSCLGHCHPALLKSLTDQAGKLWHLSNVMTNGPALKLAEKLIQLTFAERVFFANSGAEANEAALKLARRWALGSYGQQKTEIIAFEQGFHGRTFFTVTVGGQPSYSDGFGPKPADIKHLPYNDLNALAAHISDKTCAVMLEPIQGEGGIIIPDLTFLQGVRALCDKHNALLIFDEVQTGNGRTGTLYAYQQTHVIPDILTTAKGLGGGFPIGAMLTTSLLGSHMKIGTHGSTYGGNPLACAVALAVINELEKPKVMNGVIERQAWFVDGLNALNKKYKVFSDVRAKGLLIGAKLNENWQGRARDILKLAGREGLLVLVAGDNVIRLTPSLIISKAEFELGMARLDKALAKLIIQMNE